MPSAIHVILRCPVYTFYDDGVILLCGENPHEYAIFLSFSLTVSARANVGGPQFNNGTFCNQSLAILYSLRHVITRGNPWNSGWSSYYRLAAAIGRIKRRKRQSKSKCNNSHVGCQPHCSKNSMKLWKNKAKMHNASIPRLFVIAF